MKILMIVESKHLGNTMKIAKAMSEVAPITITNTEKAKQYKLEDYELVGFASGIYAWRHDKKLLDFARAISDENGYSFVVSTSGGADFDSNNKTLIDILKTKNKTVLGVFSCLALDKFSFLKLLGGINKGHPDETDLKNAQEFILEIISKYNSVNNINN